MLESDDSCSDSCPSEGNFTSHKLQELSEQIYSQAYYNPSSTEVKKPIAKSVLKHSFYQSPSQKSFHFKTAQPTSP